tara:strand:+ start:183 stop:497 length:315 start_codon:yes stop_codon:yes gene_type:complete
MEFLILAGVAVLFVWGFWTFMFKPKAEKTLQNATTEFEQTLTPKEVEANYDGALASLGLPSYEELMKLTKKQLDAQAAKQGIKLDARQTKKKMVSAYQDGLKSK